MRLRVTPRAKPLYFERLGIVIVVTFDGTALVTSLTSFRSLDVTFSYCFPQSPMCASFLAVFLLPALHGLAARFSIGRDPSLSFFQIIRSAAAINLASPNAATRNTNVQRRTISPSVKRAQWFALCASRAVFLLWLGHRSS
jgi:hypothetical protein